MSLSNKDFHFLSVLIRKNGFKENDHGEHIYYGRRSHRISVGVVVTVPLVGQLRTDFQVWPVCSFCEGAPQLSAHGVRSLP